MTRYNFTSLPDRLATNAIKWQKTREDKDLLPLWIADMDFQVFPEMTAALTQFAKRSVFGYDAPADSLFEAIIDWEQNQHGVEVAREDIVLIEGAVPAISTVVQAFTEEGDAVLINTPVYPPFARSVKLNKRTLVTNSLVVEDGRFAIDFDQLERDIVDNSVKLYIFCNPHNPGGRVWDMAELKRLGEICRQHGVIMVSDEIHQDLTLWGKRHQSFYTVDRSFAEFAIILASATKTFNIAGTKNSFVLIKNPDLRKAFTDRQLANNQHEISNLGFVATEVALREGLPWLTELKVVLEDNISDLLGYFAKELPDLRVMRPEATYLLWLDFSAYGLKHSEVARRLEEEANVQLNDGLTFGREGKCCFRLNAAAPKALIMEAAARIAGAFNNERT
ncbi:MalY/PatB family protein [Streptococcus sp. E29BA]|uniref:MalY/PatB family protein n=1 Tax=Streptococcus sp. E29BA TaxID=3278716 RepID=UPI00359F00BF